jgi:hypothetical protein
VCVNYLRILLIKCSVIVHRACSLNHEEHEVHEEKK